MTNPTTTIPQPPAPPTVPPEPRHTPWYRKPWAYMLTAVLAVGVGLGAGFALHAANEQLSASAPAASQTASQVLASDGYTVILSEDQSTINETFGSAAPYVTSVAAGTSGSNEEVVAVVTPAGISAVGGPDAFQNGISSQMPAGTTTTLNGNDLRMRGTIADFGG